MKLIYDIILCFSHLVFSAPLTPRNVTITSEDDLPLVSQVLNSADYFDSLDRVKDLNLSVGNDDKGNEDLSQITSLLSPTLAAIKNLWLEILQQCFSKQGDKAEE